MACSLSRLSWMFLAKRHANLTRCTVTVFAEKFTQIRQFHSRQQQQQEHGKRLNNFLTYTALASGLCYAVYKWKDNIQEGIKSLGVYNYSVVHASSLVPPSDGQNRNKYNFIANVVEICAPSVVYIEIKDNRRTNIYAHPHTHICGSGFIVSQDGLILTNAHVVLNKPNATIEVNLYDGSVHTGVVEDFDVHSDLATIRINKTNLPVMKLGTSSDIRPGEFVVAIGCPLTFTNSITSGVVSSVKRQSTEIGLRDKHMEYIQTDAAITFGNSGGPLVNLDGEAIGINSMKVASGISFAIPIDYAKQFLKKAEARRKQSKKTPQSGYRRRYLGMTMQSLTPDILAQIHQNGKYTFITHGVLVWKVIPDSPADVAGIRPNDIIMYANKEPVLSTDNIYKILEKPGMVRFQIIRTDKSLYINVTPDEII